MGSQPTSGRRLWPSYLDNAFMTYGRDTLAQRGRWEGGVRRRVFVRYAAAAIATWPVKARTQQAKVYRLGILSNTRAGPGDVWETLLGRLRDLGYVEGQNLILEWRYSEGYGERWPELAGELVGLKVDAIVVMTTPAALAAKQATNTVPIIITPAIDPVGAGLAASLA